MVADEAKAALGVKLCAVETYDTRCFLAPVLEGVQAESGQGRGIGVVEDAKNAAFFMQLIAIEADPGLQCAYARIPVQP